MRALSLGLVALSGMAVLATTLRAEEEHGHYDISPHFDGARLLVGGLGHDGNVLAPPVAVFGYEFGEDIFDPFNPPDPGVNQLAGTGNLPAGSALRYNILSSLLFWDGNGEVSLLPLTGDARIELSMSGARRTLTGDSDAQTGSLVQTVASDGTVHRHFVSRLFANDLSSNVPGEIDFLAPPEGIYAFSLEMTLTQDQTTYISDPFWIVFNNGLDEELHEAAMAALVPEPASLTLLGTGALALLRRRR